jgi:hypothetical protein
MEIPTKHPYDAEEKMPVGPSWVYLEPIRK